MKKRFKYPLIVLSPVLLTAAAFGIQFYRNIGGLPDENRFANLPYYRNGTFRNLHTAAELPYYPERATGKGGFIRDDGYIPKGRLPMHTLGKNSFGQAENFAYYWLGHASAILELGGQRILIDPVFDNASPVSLPIIVPRFQEAPISRENLPHIDTVLVSHDHYDHLEAATIRHLADKAARFIVPLGVGARLQSWGVPSEKISELGWGDAAEIGGVKITAETAQHYSARWRTDRNKTLWASFVLEGAGRRLYWSGDTGYGPHFAEIGKKYGGFDTVFLEIDAANAGWPQTHMFPEQSVQAALDLGAKRMVPMHWGVFSLGRNPWYTSIDAAVKTAAAKNLPLDVPKMGEKYRPDTFRNDGWWTRQDLR